MSETVEWAIALSETVEWTIAMLVAPLELYCAIVSGYYLSFKLSGKVVKDLAMIRDLMRRVCVTVTEIQT